MKCRSIACIWSPESPPPHKVTSVAVITRPPTLYTAGSDGSIVWWNISSNQKIQPVAMLCGHVAPVADLAICCPIADSGDGERDYTSNYSVSNSPNHGDLISVCTDGEMCVWSRVSGHCRRKRKMPPWVGSPSIMRVLPDNPRYVCITSCFIDGAHSFGHESLDSSDVGSSKCTVVIVDTYSLTIVQTVFHGNLTIGPLKFMALVPAMEDMEKQFILLFDSYGKLQSVPILKEPDSDEANGAHMKRYDYNVDVNEQVEGLSEELQVVTISRSGKILAFVYRTVCIFRFVKDGTAVGEFSFVDNQLYPQEGFINSHGVCGFFLHDDDDGGVMKTQESCDSITENFVVWNNSGLAVVYKITYIDSIFSFELSSLIPALNHSPEMRSSFSFIQLSSCLLRIASTCSHLEDPCLWKPHITSWSLPQQHNNNMNLSQECLMLGEGGFVDDNITSIADHNEDGRCRNSGKYGFAQEGRFVSSMMVISEPSSHMPYAVVYGFHSGEIEVVRFDICAENGSTFSKQSFLGHTRSVLCLAAHRMVGFAKGWSFRWVLISGSLDCTIRLWDIDSSNIITVMHHHVAPVRQIILPSPQTDCPWNDCFLSVGEDNCVTLISLQTLRAERMFPGHLSYPEKVVWDGKRGYLACFCQSYLKTSDALDVLYIWDIKAGTRERVLRGTASQSMFEHFCKGTNSNSAFGAGNTSASSFFHALVEDTNPSQIHLKKSGKEAFSTDMTNTELSKGNPHKQFSPTQTNLENNKHPISGYCPFPGIAALSFDLASLMSPNQKQGLSKQTGTKKEKDIYRKKKKEKDHTSEDQTGNQNSQQVMAHGSTSSVSDLDVYSINTASEDDWVQSLELCLLHFGLSFLHLWDVDSELDELLINEMKLKRPENFLTASGLLGDRGSLTLAFPSSRATLELWKISPEFTAMRALTMVSLAQRMISLSHSSSSASSALAAFYTRNFMEKIPDVKPPLLQLLVSFWQDESEYVRMAARTLFHCSASRAIPSPLCTKKDNIHEGLASSPDGIEINGNSLKSDNLLDTEVLSETEESGILSWLETFENQDWISCIGGTSQDAMTSHIIVAAALTIWYPSLVKPSLAMLVVHPLVKLVMAMNGKYSSTAAELLAEGMETTWKACIASEIPRLIGDIFFQIECVSGPQNPAVPINFQKTLVGTLLPSLAMADVPGFLQVIERQIWSTASDSPVHIVSLMTLIRIVRGSPRNLAQHLDKVVNFILQTMDPSNSVMRRTCLQSSMAALKEVVRVFPMVALNETSTRLAIGDAIGEVNNASIRVYDMQSMAKIKVLDASGPLGLPNLLGGLSEMGTTISISALSFSPEGEGLVAFSENGLMIRWWSLGSAWWEKLSRNLVPVQCTKLIFVPPWEGFSPNSTRSSIMAGAMGFDRQGNTKENTGVSSDVDKLKLLILNLDLSYHLAWVGERKVLLTRHDHDLGTFQV